MDLKPQFDQFIESIRLTPAQRGDLKTAHRTLRERLTNDEALAPIIVSTFLQGSYRRFTATRPRNEQRADADVIVVTKLHESSYTPQQAHAVFVPFFERHYKGKYEFQGRSIGISMSKADLDVVVTSAPSETERSLLKSLSVATDESLDEAEAEGWRLTKSWAPASARGLLYSEQAVAAEPEWKLAPLRIPDRDAARWDDTHPLEQLRWAREKNARCNKHFLNVVKAVKWWRRLNPEPKYPKGYPVEHMVGDCCPDGIQSVAEGVTRTLEGMVERYHLDVLLGRTPVAPDRGVPGHNVLGRVTPSEFAAFYAKVAAAAAVARQAYDCPRAKESAGFWQQLWPTFPDPPEQGGGGDGGRGPDQGGFSQRGGPTVLSGQRFG